MKLTRGGAATESLTRSILMAAILHQERCGFEIAEIIRGEEGLIVL